MDRLSEQQKQQVNQFAAVADTSQRVAMETLEVADWNLPAAFEIYFNQDGGAGGGAAAPAVDVGALGALFERYADSTHGVMMAEGVGQFCDDLEVDPSDCVMLVISWHMGAQTMCEYTREEFVGGLAALGCDSLEGLKAMLPSLRAEMGDEGKFRGIYTYAFDFSKEKGQKSLALDTAVEMWRLLFADRWPLLDEWCAFVTTQHNKAISKDTWCQLLDFCRTINTDLSNHDAEGAWPYLFDEFAEHMRERAVQQDGSL